MLSLSHSLAQGGMQMGPAYAFLMLGFAFARWFGNFLVTIFFEYLVLELAFTFQNKKSFRYTLIANFASELLGKATAWWVGLRLIDLILPESFIYSDFLLFVLVFFILAIVIESFVWIKLIKPEKSRRKAILWYTIVANIVSFGLIYGGKHLIIIIVAIVLVAVILYPYNARIQQT
jgi:hypothetical protein